MNHIELHREFNSTRINEILNHPSIRPWIANDGDGIVDIQKQLDNRANILLMGEHGGVLFLYVMSGIYEAHTQVLPSGRGKWMQALAHSCIHWMFTKTDCYELLTRVPKPHIIARAATIRSGGKYEFTREDGCLFKGEITPVDFFSMRIQDWAASGVYLEKIGEWFHIRLNEEAKKLGIVSPAHENDRNHNFVVGAVYSLFKNHQYLKALNIYNRWAILSRHATISLVSKDPHIIKMDIGFLKMNNEDIELFL